MLQRKLFLYRPLLYDHRCIHIKPDTVVIASAVRTPWIRRDGQLSAVADAHLGSLAIEAAVKQSAVPVEQVKHIFMAETLQSKRDETKKLDFSKFLKNVHYTSVTAEELDVKTVLMGLEALKTKMNEFVVVAAMESAAHNPSETRKKFEFSKETKIHNTSSEPKKNNFSNNLEIFLKAQQMGLFEAEIVPITVLQQSGNRKIPREITQDEILTEPCKIPNYYKGATALVLTTFAIAQKYNITPLAMIKNLEYSNNSGGNSFASGKFVEKLLLKSKLEPAHIHHWEMDEFLYPPISNVDLKLINPHGGLFMYGQSLATCLPRMLTHLSHSLKPFQYGCVFLNNSKEYFALIVENITLSTSPEGLPRLTLYTKDPCPLCDILVEELELNFSGEYELEKIYIDTKENVRFLRLFRHDIPVVFLNGQFLCMHRINKKLLRRKLDLLKEQ